MESRPEEPAGLADPWAVPSTPPHAEDPGVAPLVPQGVAASVYQTPPAYRAPSAQQTPPPYQGPPGYGAPAYGTPAYGTPAYGPPGYGPPGFPAPRPRSNSLPQAAMITGGIALVLGNAISMGVLGVLGGITGIVLGIVGLRRANRWGVGSSGLAAGGIIVSALSAIVGVLILIAAMPAFLEGFNDGWDEGWEEGVRQAQEQEQGAGRDVDPADDRIPATGELSPGDPIPAEWMNPDGPWLGIPPVGLGLGQATTINKYTVSVVSIDLSADAQVASAHPRNPGPYGQYVLVTVSVRNQSVLERNPLDDLMVSYPATDDYIYDETSCGALTARPVTAVGLLGLDEAAEYEVCLDIPPYAIGQPRVLVHDLTSEYWDAWMWTAG